MTPGADGFHTTRWTLVRHASGGSPEARQALSELCAAYYAPVHAYLRQTARDLGDPGDLAHDFFAALLARPKLGAEPERGRFRSYLLGAVKHFLADTRARRLALKRGAQHEHLPLADGSDTSPGVDPATPAAALPDAWFDRQWGVALLAQALAALAAELAEEGRAAHFEELKPWLTGEAPRQAETARRLGLSEGALKVAIHRLRLRFRELVKAQIGQTVSSDEELRAELRYLIEVVS